MSRLLDMNGHEKNMCSDEPTLCAQNLATILCSTKTQLGGPLCSFEMEEYLRFGILFQFWNLTSDDLCDSQFISRQNNCQVDPMVGKCLWSWNNKATLLTQSVGLHQTLVIRTCHI